MIITIKKTIVIFSIILLTQFFVSGCLENSGDSGKKNKEVIKKGTITSIIFVGTDHLQIEFESGDNIISLGKFDEHSLMNVKAGEAGTLYLIIRPACGCRNESKKYVWEKENYEQKI